MNNQKIADVRSEADASFKASQNLQKDAGRLYSLADKLWGHDKGSARACALFRRYGVDPNLVSTVERESEDYAMEDVGG